MHDIDSTQIAFGHEAENYEFPQQPVFNENEQAELAAELMEIASEAELENFIGDIVGKLIKKGKSFLGSPTGQKLVGWLKGAAKQVLPMAGKAAGDWIGGPVGAQIGGKLGSAAADRLETEAEAEEREWEAANTFVKLAGDAVKNAAAAPPGNPNAIAQRAVMQAAAIHAPGLLANAPQAAAKGGSSGHWVRRGNRIIVFGV
jgi:hypothetical protein